MPTAFPLHTLSVLLKRTKYRCLFISEATPRLTLCNRSYHPNKALAYYTKALHELCKAVTSYPKE